MEDICVLYITTKREEDAPRGAMTAQRRIYYCPLYGRTWRCDFNKYTLVVSRYECLSRVSPPRKHSSTRKLAWYTNPHEMPVDVHPSPHYPTLTVVGSSFDRGDLEILERGCPPVHFPTTQAPGPRRRRGK